MISYFNHTINQKIRKIQSNIIEDVREACIFRLLMSFHNAVIPGFAFLNTHWTKYGVRVRQTKRQQRQNDSINSLLTNLELERLL